MRDCLIKLSAVAFCTFLNRYSVVAADILSNESLANEWRHIAPFYRAASKGLEHQWFLPDNVGDYWSCMACPGNSEEAAFCPARNQTDAFFSAYCHTDITQVP
jgi:hypothetical protein